jgi:hypothetical protein
MFTQRRSSSAVCGYSSLSIMFLASALGHQLLGLGLHPGGDERGQVEPGVAVQDELVADHLERGARQHAVRGQPVPGDLGPQLLDVDRVDVELVVLAGPVHLSVQRHEP